MAVALAVIVCIAGFIGYIAYAGEIPAIGSGVAVCDVKVTVNYRWTNVEFPGVPDTVKITSLTVHGQNWREVFLSLTPTVQNVAYEFNVIDTDKAKLVWELRNSEGETVRSGTISGLTLHPEGSWIFNIPRVQPGTYTVTVSVYQWWELDVPLIGQKDWAHRDTESAAVTLTAPG